MYFKAVCVVVLFGVVGMGSAATSIQFSRLNGNASAGLDYETQRCMQCHDGVVAHDVELSFAGSRTGMLSLHAGQHPVGMNYADYVRATPLEYRPQDSLGSEVRLVDGQVSCVSCHLVKQMQSQQELSTQMVEFENNTCLSSDALNKDARQTRLCQSCHIR